LDDDIPGGGQHYCMACARYFADQTSLDSHKKSKPHKRLVAKLVNMVQTNTKPHTAADAERAGGMGRPDHGPRLRDTRAVQDVTMGS
jgi:bud site selection protein 20